MSNLNLARAHPTRVDTKINRRREETDKWIASHIDAMLENYQNLIQVAPVHSRASNCLENFQIQVNVSRIIHHSQLLIKFIAELRRVLIFSDYETLCRDEVTLTTKYRLINHQTQEVLSQLLLSVDQTIEKLEKTLNPLESPLEY